MLPVLTEPAVRRTWSCPRCMQSRIAQASRACNSCLHATCRHGTEEPLMRQFSKAVCVLTALLLFPALAHAQATLAGTVRDASGGVLPGVTIEASSPALIEK